MRWRTGDKEKKKDMFLQSIPGIICAEQPERRRNSHTSCCLFMKHPPGEIISLWELISLFLIKKYKESRRIWETIWRTQKNILELLKVLLCFMTLLGRTWCISWDKDILTPDSKTRVLGKAVAYGDEWLGNESVEKREDEIAVLPTGNQVVPTIEPDWDYNTAKGRWDQSHFFQKYSWRTQAGAF